MRILFVIDKIEYKYFEFNDLVTNFWLIKEFSTNNNVDITTINKLTLIGDTAYATVHSVEQKEDNIIFNKDINFQENLDNYDLIFFRSDPPVDDDYICATYIFDFCKKAKVINSPFAIRNFNEKLHALLFKEYMPQSIVSASLKEIETFLDKHNEIILKPLNKCFGSGVFYLKKGDLNTRSIINTITNNENSQAMIQEYLSIGKHGDKRVLTLGNKVLDYSIVKHPTNDDFKFNTHNSNFISKGSLSKEEKENYTKIAQKLNSMGIHMAGFDVIDGKIIEINVTSPCYFIKEINEFFNTKLEKEICSYFLESPCYNAKNVV